MLLNIRFPIILAFFSVYFAVTFVSGQNECTVTTRYGDISGTLANTLNRNKKVCTYLSIPYASPPVGSLRFLPPVPPKAWETTLDAITYPNWCPQSGTPPQGIQISENCLFLNVYQPQTNATNLPVMIWFHGGSYTSGSSLTFNPIRMQSRETADIIMVIVQYRLGTLGFLSTGDSVVPGNGGLKDQSFAIRWVNQNIQAFGGNPKQVTIFGESAGAGSVMYQMISPLNKGLIHGAIVQSGTALSSYDKNPAESAKLMAGLLGCPSVFGSSVMVSCMRNISWQAIIAAQNLYSAYQISQMATAQATLTPVVEPKLPGAFISDDPEVLLKTGDIPDIPLILGANKHDGSLGLAALYLTRYGPLKLDRNPEYMKDKMVPDLLKYFKVNDEFPGSRMSASTAELAYLNGVNRSSFEESMPGLVDLFTVLGFKSATQNVAEILTRRNRKVYLYSFEHHSNNTMWHFPQIPVNFGIAHGDELIYLFPFPSTFSTRDRSFSELFCDLWLNFGKTGNPTPTTDKRFENWAPYNVMDEPFLKINGTPTLQYGYRNSWRPNGFEWN